MKSECIAFVRDPEQYCQNASKQQWTAFIDEARQYALLGSCYFLAQDHDVWARIPAAVQNHLVSGYHYAEKQKITLLNELIELEKIFTDSAIPALLVKGVAYRVDGYSLARGRVFSDIDLLVPDSHFAQALEKLKNAGYLEFSMSAYDRRYYLRWTHQHPPLTHFLRGANIDLHHHIFPVSSRENIRVEPIVEQAIPLTDSAFSVPSPAHLFMHAAVHLFYQDETHKLVKDLVDLYLLYQEVITRQPFSDLVAAAQQSNAQAAVFYALSTLQQVFAIQLPAEAGQLAPAASRYRTWQMQFLLTHLLDHTSAWHRPAHFFWFVRGHLLKMGPLTLLYHSIAKSIEQFKERRELSKKQQQADAHTRPGDAH